MIDKILFKQLKIDSEVIFQFILVYDNRDPLLLSADSLTTLNELLDWLLIPSKFRELVPTLTDYQALIERSSEDTINLIKGV